MPVLDLGRLETGPDELVSEAGAAYREYGFCGFRNHGIPGEVIDEAYAAIAAFFAQPDVVKNSYRSVDGGQRGYTPLGTEHARDNPVPDLKEFWHTGRERGRGRRGRSSSIGRPEWRNGTEGRRWRQPAPPGERFPVATS